jgi:ATP-dependent helicase HrpB
MAATLPIESSLPELRAALDRAGAAVLQAPPGAGKTTRVPLALLGASWMRGRRIVMLEPRRLATRAAAGRMAQVLGEEIGETVGYRIRHDTRVGPRTRIEVVTEGVLTRMLQSDPGLEQVALVIFDEFHERSLHADLGLALALQTKHILREDLRLLVMSATLDGGPVAALLGGAPIVTSEGRSWPVETRYLPPRRGVRLEVSVGAAIREALDAESGDLLAFLPGAAEIRRVAMSLAGTVPADVIPLHGSLPHELQDHAIRPSPAGRRKVVLATSIAETSLTIEGVRVVVDSGLSRVPKYSPRSGMTRLATVRVSRASADQRRGRAGRVTAGVCYRLWPSEEDAQLIPAIQPEIFESDLAPLALDLAVAGVTDPAELSWLDPPPAGAFAEARRLLSQLGALDPSGRPTDHGRAMARLALHPRLAHMVIRGTELEAGRLACSLAALLAERDLLSWPEGASDADLSLRIEILRGTTIRDHVDREVLRRVRAEARLCEKGRRPGADGVSLGVLASLAYPDRIARRRKGELGRYLLRNGQGASLEPQILAREEFLVAVDLDPDWQGRARILLAAPLSLAEIEEHANGMEHEDVVAWDEESRAVTARHRVRLGSLVLRESPIEHPDAGLILEGLLDHIRKVGIDGLPWDHESRSVRARLAFLRRLDPGWPDQSDEALQGTLADWLGPTLLGVRRAEELARVDIKGPLLSRLSWEQRARLDELAPSHIQVPSGSRIPVSYEDPDAPVLAVRLQEMFGLAETPRVASGRIPVTLHLLSPAHRPVQVTRDLAGFWRTTYFEVRKDLKGRYPKHFWPDDPLQAEPTRYAKRRGSRPGT